MYESLLTVAVMKWATNNYSISIIKKSFYHFTLPQCCMYRAIFNKINDNMYQKYFDTLAGSGPSVPKTWNWYNGSNSKHSGFSWLVEWNIWWNIIVWPWHLTVKMLNNEWFNQHTNKIHVNGITCNCIWSIIIIICTFTLQT